MNSTEMTRQLCGVSFNCAVSPSDGSLRAKDPTFPLWIFSRRMVMLHGLLVRRAAKMSDGADLWR